MTKYPIYSRPVIQLPYEELNAVTGRLMTVQNVRKIKPDRNYILEKMGKAFF